MAASALSGLEPGETQFWRQPDAAPPEQFTRAFSALYGVQLVSLSFYGLLTLVCGASAFEWRSRLRYEVAEGDRNSRMLSRVSLWIFVHVATSLFANVTNMVMYHTAFESRDMVPMCHWFHKVGAADYIVTLGAQYMVLLLRAELTLDESSRWSRLSFKLTKLMTIAGMPAMVVLALITFKGTVFYAETCTQELVLWLVWLFMVSDSGLSGCFLLMFILPVFKHARSRSIDCPKSRAATQRMLATARHNLRLSLVQIVSTLAAQCVGGVLQTAFRDDMGHPENSFWRLVTFAAYICDLVVNTVALLFMSSAWQPSVLFEMLREGRTKMSIVNFRRNNAGSQMLTIQANAAAVSAAGPSMASTAPQLSTQATSVVLPASEAGA